MYVRGGQGGREGERRNRRGDKVRRGKEGGEGGEREGRVRLAEIGLEIMWEMLREWLAEQDLKGELPSHLKMLLL